MLLPPDSRTFLSINPAGRGRISDPLSIPAALARQQFGTCRYEHRGAVDCAQTGQVIRMSTSNARGHRQQASNRALAPGDFDLFAVLEQSLNFRKAVTKIVNTDAPHVPHCSITTDQVSVMTSQNPCQGRLGGAIVRDSRTTLLPLRRS